MLSRTILSVSALALAGALFAAPAAAQSAAHHDHAAHAGHDAKPQVPAQRWATDAPLRAVVCSLSALASLSKAERGRAIDLLQRATADGGVHLVEGVSDGRSKRVLDDVVARYAGWRVTMDSESGNGTLVAMKEVA